MAAAAAAAAVGGSQWLPAAVQSLDALTALLATTFGPCGRDKIAVDAVGNVLISNSAAAMAKHANNQQPVARLALSAMASHSHTVGDGSSALLLLLTGCAREALAYTQNGAPASAADSFRTASGAGGGGGASEALTPRERQQRRKLLRSLEAVQHHWIADGALERWLVQSKARTVARADDAAVQQAALQLVRTLLVYKLSPQSAAALADIVVQLVFAARASSAQPLHSVCASLLSDCPAVLCGQLPLSESKVMNGFLVPRARVALRSMPTALHDVRMVLLHCDVHSVPPAHELRAGHVRLEAHTAQTALAFLAEGERVAERWVRRFQAEGVRLLLSTHKLHDATLALLSAAGIAAVHCLDEFDTRRLASYAHTHPVRSLADFEARFDGVTERAPPLPVAHVGAFAQVLVGSELMLHIELADLPAIAPSSASSSLAESSSFSSSSPASSSSRRYAQRIRPRTLLLCGSGDGMCKQYEALVTRCLRLLLDWSSGCAEMDTPTAAPALAAAATNAPVPSHAHAAAAPAAKAITPAKPTPPAASSSMFGALRGGFFGTPARPAATPRDSAPPAPRPPPATPATAPTGAAQPSLWVVGGGGASELSLLLFCEAQARLPPHSAQPPHPLLPPAPSAPASGGGDTAAAFRVLAAGLALLLRTLLENSLPSAAGSAVAGTFAHAASLPWIKMLPHLRATHDHSGVRNLGFVFNNVLDPLPYSPLHLRLRAATGGARGSSTDLITQQLAVARAEMALSSLLPPLFSLGDTLAMGGAGAGAGAALAESVSSKVRLVAGALDLLTTLLRVEGMLHVRAPGSSGSSGLAALNISGRVARRRVRTHDPWQESGSDDSDDDSSGDDDDTAGDDD